MPDPAFAQPDFSREQRSAVDMLRTLAASGSFHVALLDGVTGSGKTEVYFEAIAENIRRDRNRAAIVLWSVANETPVSDARNAFLRTLIGDVRALDDSRLVTAALLSARRGKVMRIDDPLVGANLKHVTVFSGLPRSLICDHRLTSRASFD